MSEKETSTIKPYQWIILLIIFLSGFFIRIYDLKDPPLDFHSTRQLRSYLIARAVFYKDNPAFTDEVQKQAIALADLEVYEPPILEQLVGLTYKLVGQEFFWIARIHMALYWVLGGLAIFLIGKRFFAFPSILIGLAFYFFLPFSVIASRSFQPDPFMTMWMLWTVYALVRWYENPNWKWTIIAGSLGGAAILVKVVAAAFIMGMIGFTSLAKFGFKHLFRTPFPWVMAGIAAAPTLAYYLLFHQQRTGSFLTFWTLAFLSMLADPGFYADWLAMVKGLMGLNMFLLGVLGVVFARDALKPILAGAWVGYVLYGLIFPYQYITHEYYHVPLVAIVALSIMPVADILIEKLGEQNWFWRAVCAAALMFASFYSLYVARSNLIATDYTNEPASWRKVGEAVPQGKNFIALTPDYGMRLRYYGWRVMAAAWPTTGDQALVSLRGDEKMDFPTYFSEATAGKDFFLIASLVDFDSQSELKEHLNNHYPLFMEGNGFFVYDLRQEK